MTCGQIADSISRFFFSVIVTLSVSGFNRAVEISFPAFIEHLRDNIVQKCPRFSPGDCQRALGLYSGLMGYFASVIAGSDAKREKSRVPDHWCSWCERSVQWGLFTRSQTGRPAREAVGMWAFSPGEMGISRDLDFPSVSHTSWTGSLCFICFQISVNSSALPNLRCLPRKRLKACDHLMGPYCTLSCFVQIIWQPLV